MSMYNMLFGQNPMSDLFLGMAGLRQADVGRFRDSYVERADAPNSGWYLCVYTRNGGGNRQHWNDEKEEGPDCDCTGCIAAYRLPRHPLYVSDADDDFDCTYATFRFQIPNQFWPFFEELESNSSKEGKPAERWDRLLEKLNSAKDDPEVRNAMSVMAPILDQIKTALAV